MVDYMRAPGNETFSRTPVGRNIGNTEINQFKKTINIYIYVCNTVIDVSRICMLKVLRLAVSHFHFSSARHPCCTPVQHRFALDGK